MTRAFLTRSAGVACVAVAAFVVPGEAMAEIAQHAETAVQYLDELAIVAGVLIVAVLLDTTSWSFMTNRR